MKQKHLVIVESPAKAKTINKYLGGDYYVTSSQGHIRDLPVDELAIDIEHNFKPKYVINKGKNGLVNELKKASKEADIVYLASDDDREGEAISWHLKEALEIDDDKVKRIVFHEITQKAIENAIKNPRTIDINLVDSQKTRRVLDRLVGYKLSPILWKIQPKLSAGRVQSVAVKMIVDKERTIQKFESTSSVKVVAKFLYKETIMSAELKHNIENIDITRKLFEILKDAKFTITNVEKKAIKTAPQPPFTTSTLQQEANRQLHFTVSQTMLLAQHLYESGKISYMRTDAVILSEDAIKQAKDAIIKEYGDDYYQERKFINKTMNAQEAHEAIRPTNFSDLEVSEDPHEQKLYTLIRRRAMASQMADAQKSKTTVTITNDKDDSILVAYGTIIKFNGFMAAYVAATDDDTDKPEENILPNVKQGESVLLSSLFGKERYSRGPSRFSEASLVKELEEQGIGRPSTYAPIINTIQQRGYVIKHSENRKLVECKTIKMENDTLTEGSENEKVGGQKDRLYPTDISFIVNDFLVEHFSKITDYKFTANMEVKLDEIALGKETYENMMHNFYDNFEKQLSICDSIPKQNTTRLLGQDPKSGESIYAYISKYGPVIRVGEKDQSPKYFNLLKDQDINAITLEEAIQLTEFPKSMGKYNDIDVVICNGKYGPYIKYKEANIKLPTDIDVFNVSLEDLEKIIDKYKTYKKTT